MVDAETTNKIKNLLNDIYHEYKSGSSYRGNPLFNHECEELVELIAKDTNVDNIYNLIVSLNLTEEEFTALGYRLESIYYKINNFDEEVRLDGMLMKLASEMYPKSIVFWRWLFKKCRQ